MERTCTCPALTAPSHFSTSTRKDCSDAAIRFSVVRYSPHESILGVSKVFVRRERSIVASGVAGFSVGISLRAIALGSQTVFDRIADQFGVVFNAELLHEAHLVRANGLGAQHEHIGYGIDAFARRQQVQHLELTI